VTDDELRHAYARHLADGPHPGRQRCATPEALLALVERRGSEADRLTTLDHAGSCEACRRDLELLRAVHRAGETSAGRPALRWISWVPAPHLRLAAAAALVIVVGAVATMTLRRHGIVMRGGAPVLRLVSPADAVPAGEPLTLTWRPAPGTERYEVELLSASGDSMFSASTPDTVLTLPVDVALVAGNEYLWSVRALLHDGTHATSAPLRFRLRQR
jgi:hypothetical protein